MQRYLVAINCDVPHDGLATELRVLAVALGDDAQFHLVVPTVAHATERSDGHERARAQRLLNSVASALEGVPNVDGEVGDADVFVAIGDVLNQRPYDVLVIATPVIDAAEQAGLVEHLVRTYGLPVIRVTAPPSIGLQPRSLPVHLPSSRGIR